MARLTAALCIAWSIASLTACGSPYDAAEPAGSEAALSANLTAPPLGWNSWNTFAEAIDYNVIKAQADAMASSGMKAAGYQYVNIDAGWWLGTRDSQGNITVDQGKWPGGMKAIADYIHGKGLKAGIYTDAGKNGCIYWYPTNGPAGPGTGSEGHYDQDFLQFSQWGFDYVKVDWCGGQKEGLNAQTQYTQISQAIDRATAQTGRPMVLSVCEWGSNSPWNWAPAISSLWRTSNDIVYFGQAPSMNNVLGNFDAAQHPSAQSPGHANDPDMLMVGMPGLSAAQNRTHISLWAISGAPLIAGNNLATMSAETTGILTNRDMLAIDQDPLGRQGTKVAEDQAGLQVWSKVLSGTGRRGVLLLNRNTAAANITVRWSSLGLTSGSASVRNVWSGADLGAIPTSYTVSVPSRDSVLLLVSDGGNPSYTLTVAKAGTGAGTVTSSPAGIDCGAACTASYASATNVTLTASPAAGSTFTGWGGACSGTSSTCTVAMSAARSVTVTFDGLPGSPISINAGGAAVPGFLADSSYSGGSTYSTTSAVDTSQVGGTVPPQAVFQSERYGEFTYTITSNVAPGSPLAVTLYFAEVYWTGPGQRTFDVIVNGTAVLSGFDIFAAAGGANKAIARTFNTTSNSSGQVVIQFTRGGGVDNPKVSGITVGTINPSMTLTVTRAGAGSGTVTGTGIACGTTCSALYGAGISVTLTASAATGSTFAGWSGACTGTSPTCTVAITGAKAVTATFDTAPANACTAVSGGQSGNFNTTGAICFTVSGTVNGWGCSNVDGRTVSVNGTAVTCGQMPLPGGAPYTFNFSAGTYSWASFYWW